MSPPSPVLALRKIEEPSLQMAHLQIGGGPSCIAFSSRVANPVSPVNGKSATLYESRRDSKKHHKRRGTAYNILDIFVQRLATRQSRRLPQNSRGDLEGRRDFCDALTLRGQKKGPTSRHAAVEKMMAIRHTRDISYIHIYAHRVPRDGEREQRKAW